MSAAAEPRLATIAELQAPQNRAEQLRRVPMLVGGALRVVWTAARWNLAGSVALQAAAAAAIGAQLLISRAILRSLIAVSHGAPVSRAYLPFALLACLTAALGAINALLAHQQKLLAELTARHAFDSIIAVAAGVDFRSFETPDFYDRLHRARYSGMYRTIDMVNSVLALTTGLLTSLGIAIVLVVLQPLLLVFVLVASLFPLLAAVRNGKRSYTFDYAMTAESRERLYLMETLTEREPAKEIRVFRAGPFLQERWAALTEERIRRVRSFLRDRLVVALVGTLAGSLGTAVGLGALLYLLSSGRLAVAGAITAGLAMQQLGSRLTGLTSSVGNLIESGLFLDDFQRFLQLAPAPEPAAEPTARPRRPFGGLQLENVSFRYPTSTTNALEGVDLEVEPGEVVALVGANGSGKTTLVKLICQLYAPDDGRILWDGRDLSAVSAGDVRDEITVLFQDYNRYFMSARDNIVIGRPEAARDLARAEQAAARAGADAVLQDLPDGLDTRLGLQFFGGHELSGGQWQRLALARAFFRDGSFLILDEPTASLDPRAEAELFEQMRQLADGRSVLLVSHRFSTVRSADRIYVLEGGRVVESGSHAELMALGGTYAELFTLQADSFLGPLTVA